MTAAVAAGVTDACGDAAGGNLMECAGSLKADQVLCKTRAFTASAAHQSIRGT
jgi:hypothetical protein